MDAWIGKENWIMSSEKEARHGFDIRQDPYNHVRRVIFGRWKPYLLHAMAFDGEVTNFSKFTRQLPITEKVLAQNLRELEEDGLLTRTILPTTPPRTEYRLTESGRSLIPILDTLYDWGWHDMTEKGLPIDRLGEMWHGYRDRDPELMTDPYKK